MQTGLEAAKTPTPKSTPPPPPRREGAAQAGRCGYDEERAPARVYGRFMQTPGGEAVRPAGVQPGSSQSQVSGKECRCISPRPSRSPEQAGDSGQGSPGCPSRRARLPSRVPLWK